MRLMKKLVAASIVCHFFLAHAQTIKQPKKVKHQAQVAAVREFTKQEQAFASEILKIFEAGTRTGKLEGALKGKSLAAVGNVDADPFTRRWPELIKKFGLDTWGPRSEKLPPLNHECIVVGTTDGFRAYKHIFRPSEKIDQLIQKHIDSIEEGMVTDFYAKRVLELESLKKAHSFFVITFVFADGAREVNTDFILGPCNGCDRYPVAANLIATMKN